MNPVIVIGGGLAGLAAATRLAEAGIPVRVLEANGYAGGRAASFTDDKTGDWVDHGQHLLIGAYRETRRFFERIGVMDLVRIQSRTRVDFLHSQYGLSSLDCPNWPAPLHLLIGLWRLNHLTWRDKLMMTGLGPILYATNPDRQPALDHLTVREWLTRCRQTVRSQREFWDILTIAVLNEKPESASAALFIKVLREAFLFRAEHSRVWLPKTALGQLYPPAAQHYLEQRGSSIRFHSLVRRLRFSGDRLRKIELKTGEQLEVDQVICAIPPSSLAAILPDAVKAAHFTYLDRFEASCIIGVNLWWDRPILDQPFVGLIDSPVEWVFDKSQLYDPALACGRHLALVISAANDFADWSKADLIALGLRELRRFFPAARTSEPYHASVIKNRRATFAQRAGMGQFRPAASTPFRNFQLAGDWTDTGLPATIESAVLSGHRAAEWALQQCLENEP